MKIKSVDLYSDVIDGLLYAIHDVVLSGNYILGEQVAKFEAEFSNYIGVNYGVGVASGTDAITIALRAMGIGEGEGVITTGLAPVAVLTGILRAGAFPIIIDINSSYTMDDRQLVQAIKDGFGHVILPIHLYGRPANMPEIMKIAHHYKLKVIEDCSQAHGATINGQKVGSFGDAGIFSFYPTKNLGAMGDAGMVVTNDEQIAGKAKRLRQYGLVDGISIEHGFNSRMDEIQATILRCKLPLLDTWNLARFSNAEYYNRRLPEYATPDLVAGHVFHQYVIRSSRREQLMKTLNDKGLQTQIHYPYPTYLHPAYNWVKSFGDLPETIRASKEVLSLPIYPSLSTEEIDYITDVIHSEATNYEM